MELLDLLEKAVRDRVKVNIQMQDTISGQFVLFHPYAIVKDLFTDDISVFGLVEKHYMTTEQNYFKRPTLKGLKTVNLLKEKFTPISNWIDIMNTQTFEIILKAD